MIITTLFYFYTFFIHKYVRECFIIFTEESLEEQEQNVYSCSIVIEYLTLHNNSFNDTSLHTSFNNIFYTENHKHITLT